MITTGSSYHYPVCLYTPDFIGPLNTDRYFVFNPLCLFCAFMWVRGCVRARLNVYIHPVSFPCHRVPVRELVLFVWDCFIYGIHISVYGHLKNLSVYGHRACPHKRVRNARAPTNIEWSTLDLWWRAVAYPCLYLLAYLFLGLIRIMPMFLTGSAFWTASSRLVLESPRPEARLNRYVPQWLGQKRAGDAPRDVITCLHSQLHSLPLTSAWGVRCDNKFSFSSILPPASMKIVSLRMRLLLCRGVCSISTVELVRVVPLYSLGYRSDFTFKWEC